MRFIGLDVHRDFCEVAIFEEGTVRFGPRVPTTPNDLKTFAESLSPTDEVALENTGNARAVAGILEPYVARVAVANALAVRLISHAKVKTDRIDAKVLAQLLAAGFLPEVFFGGEQTRILRRRVSRRVALIKARTAAKSEVHAVLQRNLVARPPVSDLFGKKGRVWLAEQPLAVDELETVQACLRHIDLLDAEIARIDRALAEHALSSPQIPRLMTIPGIDVVTATAFVAAVGDIDRFSSPAQLVSYLGLNPTVHQSGLAAARHGRISKAGSSVTRWLLVEAAWSASRSPGPLHAFAQRVRARRGAQIAAVAVARKLVVLCWHLLTRDQDYAFARPTLVRQKMRRLQLATGADRQQGRHGTTRTWASPELRAAERAIAAQAELAYRRLVADWKATRKGGAGATTGARIT